MRGSVLAAWVEAWAPQGAQGTLWKGRAWSRTGHRVFLMRKEEEEYGEEYGVKEQQGKVWLAKTRELGEEGEESEEAPHGCSEGSC